jgi:hypothetical protein
MIHLPSTLTPVPRYPGYFWDVKSHKMFSLKVGGELREMAGVNVSGKVSRTSSRDDPVLCATQFPRTESVVPCSLKTSRDLSSSTMTFLL